MLKRIINLTNITLLTALCLSTVAAWFAIAGLVAIFPAKANAIIIMGAIIEVAKIVATIWLRKYWHVAGWPFKALMIPMVVIAMALTSMGTFGFLSSAHSEQSSVSGDVTAQVNIIDEKIKTQRDNIELARRALQQMDEQVNQRLSRSDSESGAERAVQIRRQQTSERAKLQKEISDAQAIISKLNDERAPIASQLRKVEAEVGPVKYIAALVYGDNPDANTLERAVRWVIIMLVLVFDPFAIALVLAGNASKKWDSEDSLKEQINEETVVEKEPEVKEEPIVKHEEKIDTEDDWEERISNIEGSTPWPTEWNDTPTDWNEQEKDFKEKEFDISEHPYLFKGGFGFKDSVPLVAKVESHDQELTASDDIVEPEVINKDVEQKIPDAKKQESDDFFSLKADSELKAVSSGFGSQFPQNPVRGDIYVRTDMLPHRVFKWDSTRWIELSKNTSSTYLYDTSYIQFLIEKLDSGEYDVDHLTDAEKDQIREYFREINSKNNILGDNFQL